jgi:hypothetical protein
MTHDEALQHALGYAAGHEDASGTRTYGDFTKFAEAFAAGWDAYRTEQRGHMTNARDAYKRWNETRGASIFDR